VKPELLASVAVCTYERYDCLGTCLAALERQLLPAPCFEVLVVDNSPDADRSAQEASKYAHIPNLRWVYEATPGLSNARNVAARIAQSPIVAYIDDDAFADPDWLERLIDAYDALGSKAVGVGGRVRPRFPVERPAWLSDELLGYLSVVDNGSETRLLRPGEWVAGANVSYRRDALLAVGGFSQALGRIGSGISLMSNDETELAERLAKAGGEMGYAPTAAVEHLVDLSRLNQNWFRRRIAWQAVSDYVRAPSELRDSTAERWRDLRIFLAHQPPHLRTLRALTVDRDQAGDLRWQMSAVYGSIVCLLSGVGDSDD
jgi:glycosyltransferase involved in cell wall biosynthesis